MSITAQLEVRSRFGGGVVVTIRVHDACTRGTSMIATIGWDGWMCWVSSLLLLASVGSFSCGASVTGLV